MNRRLITTFFIGIAATLVGMGPLSAAQLTPVSLEGGWALPGRYLVAFSPDIERPQVRAALDPTRPLTYAYTGTGRYTVLFDDRDATAMIARRTELLTRPGVQSVTWSWWLSPGGTEDPLSLPGETELAGSRYDPAANRTQDPLLGPQNSKRHHPVSSVGLHGRSSGPIVPDPVPEHAPWVINPELTAATGASMVILLMVLLGRRWARPRFRDWRAARDRHCESMRRQL